MKYLLTNGQMQAADRREMIFTPAIELMERAGRAVADFVQKIDRRGRILCVCGGGNNGGDGFVCARYLLEKNYDVSVLCKAENFSAETEDNKKKFLEIGGQIAREMPRGKISVIVDCLIGTGFKGELRRETAALIQEINSKKEEGVYVVAVDIPSGICGDNGLGKIAVQADETLCIAAEKIGIRLSDGLDCAGRISVVDIGIKPKEKYAGEFVRLQEKEDIKRILPTRKRNSHKGTYGKVAIVAGSEEYSGAALLALKSALKSGAGYVTLFTPQGIKSKYMLQAPEALLVGLNGGGSVEFYESDFEKLCGYDAISYGMGMTVSKDVYKGVIYLLEHYEGKLILDADALNSIAAYGHIGDFLRKKKCDVLITPHLKEFSRLTGLEMTEILQDPIAYTKKISQVYGLSVLLKGAATVISDGRFSVVNATGCSAQAKGGSGDVLSGLIGGLCAQGLAAFDGARAGNFLAGFAAELAAQKWTEYAATPTDFIEQFGAAFSAITENSDEGGNN